MKAHPFSHEVNQYRKSEIEHEILPYISHRWSPRSMTGESLLEEELFSLFEAARWAPSSYNNQPWRFLYAQRATPEWPLFFDLMGAFNQSWTKNAGVLLVVLSAKQFAHSGKPSRTHSFDTGAAWMAMALEATSRGLVIHGMEGFDYERTYTSLHIPKEAFQVEAMVAIGKRAPVSKLPSELQEREKPSLRRPINESISSGVFPREWKNTS